jgi:hypothetical protein
MPFYDAIRAGASGATELEIERSLRFNPSDSPQLKRTGSTTSSSYTVSMWFKYTGATKNELNLLFSLGQSNDGNSAFLGINNNDQFVFYNNGSYQFTSSFVFRDPTAWYHFTLSVNSNSSTIYLNNEIFDFGTIRSLDTSSDGIRLGIQYGNNYPFNGYIADFYLIDGSALTPSSFTETNAETGQLIPKKYSGSFGTSGAHLLFNDNSGTTATTLGKDTSGNGNNFTPSGFSVSAGSGNDSVIDTPTNNFPTLNSLTSFGGTSPQLTNGDLDFTMTSNAMYPMSTLLIPKSGKWYAEVVITADGISQAAIIVSNPFLQQNSSGASATNRHNGVNYYGTDIRIDDNNNIQTGVTAIGVNNTIGICVDRDAGTVLFKNNNNNVGVAQSYSGTAGSMDDAIFGVGRGSNSGSNITGHYNFGQRPFTYTPPTGFKALCSQNLPDPTILLPNKHFDTLIWDGNSTNNRAITGLNFQPDWVWIKKRLSSIMTHWIVDALRPNTDIGTGNGNEGALASNSSDAEQSHPDGGFESFDANGFTLGKGSNDANADSAYQRNNASGGAYVGWCWDAGETDSATYRVVVVSDSGNKYRFRNSANTATFAQSAVVLDLAEGGTYTFDQSDSTMSSHPMKLSTTANGTHGGGTSYNTGVTYQLDGSTVTESAFVSGFSSATSRKLIITVAASAPTLYYYCHYHSGMGSSINTNSTLGSSNFDGSVQSTVKVSTTAGFSIITHAGTGQPRTIGHGLGVTPQVIISKARNSSDDWMVWHHEIATSNIGNFSIALNSNGGRDNASQYWYDSLPDSTVFKRGNYSSGDNMIAYLFSGVDGYSKFGSYTGNGNANGLVLYLGFSPAFLLIRRTDSGNNWRIFDSKRNAFNVVNSRLYADTTGTESTGSAVDFLSNGVKMRNSDNGMNTSGGTYIYFAFAKSPSKNSRAR